MSIRATSPSWKAVESASRSPNSLDRPLEHLPRLPAFELDRQLAGLEVVEQLDARLTLLPPRHPSLLGALRRLAARPARPSSSSVRRGRRTPGSSRRRPRASSQPAIRPVDGARRARRWARGGTRAADRRAPARGCRGGRSRRPGAACPRRRARSCPGSRCRRPSAGRRRGGSRRGAAGARATSLPKRCSRPLDQRVEPRLRLGRPRSCSAARPCRRSSRRGGRWRRAAKPSSPSRQRRCVELVGGDAGDDEVLLARDADVGAGGSGEIGEREHLVAETRPTWTGTPTETRARRARAGRRGGRSGSGSSGGSAKSAARGRGGARPRARIPSGPRSSTMNLIRALTRETR